MKIHVKKVETGVRGRGRLVIFFSYYFIVSCPVPCQSQRDKEEECCNNISRCSPKICPQRWTLAAQVPRWCVIWHGLAGARTASRPCLCIRIYLVVLILRVPAGACNAAASAHAESYLKGVLATLSIKIPTKVSPSTARHAHKRTL